MPIDETPVNLVREECLAMICQAKVMTISTGKTTPWAAPVYYLYADSFFYFFSNSKARHIIEGVGRPCAAAVFRDDTDPTHLQGLQMSGGIEICPLDAATAKLALAYARHFDIKPTTTKVLDYFKNCFHAGLYRFIPDAVYYMDNRRAIGARTKIEL